MIIGFIGPGRLGSGLAHLLAARGYTIGAIAGRTHTAAQALAAAIPNCRAATPQEVAATCDLVFITTPDAAIQEVARALSWRAGQGVVHCSGAEPASLLETVRAYGAVPGAFHPLQTVPDTKAALENLPGSLIAIEAEGPLFAILTDMAQALGCWWITLRPQERPAYHAAAVLVSNYTVTLLRAGVDVWRALGKNEEEAAQALVPLLQGTVNNLRRLGPAASLTGPVARGDWNTVRKNLDALAQATPHYVPTYAALALATLDQRGLTARTWRKTLLGLMGRAKG